MSLRVLCLFSDPSRTLHLDREDRILSRLADRVGPGKMQLIRHHAAGLDDIHRVLLNGLYDVVHISGHGSTSGVYLDASNYTGSAGLTVPADRLLSLLDLMDPAPRLLILLSCYSKSSLPVLIQAAPFVLTAVGKIADASCLAFTEGFYSSLVAEHGFEQAMADAQRFMAAQAMSAKPFHLSRRAFKRMNNKLFVQITPPPKCDSIIVDLSRVQSSIASLGLSEAEFCHALERRLKLHYWIFSCPRERAVIPISKTMFGEFSWQDMKDVVACVGIFRLREDTPPECWALWSGLQMYYNDLASAEYRSYRNPGDAEHKFRLTAAVKLFLHHVASHFIPRRSVISSLGFASVLPCIEMAHTACEYAVDQLALERWPQVVQALETALAHLHEVVDGLRPPPVSSEATGGS